MVAAHSGIMARLGAVFSHKLVLLSVLLVVAAGLGAGLGMAAPVPADAVVAVRMQLHCADLELSIPTGRAVQLARAGRQ